MLSHLLRKEEVTSTSHAVSSAQKEIFATAPTNAPVIVDGAASTSPELFAVPVRMIHKTAAGLRAVDKDIRSHKASGTHGHMHQRASCHLSASVRSCRDTWLSRVVSRKTEVYGLGSVKRPARAPPVVTRICPWHGSACMALAATPVPS